MIIEPKVFNRHHGNAPADAIYIGRGSLFGNPFIIGVDGDRITVIDKFRKYILKDKELLELAKFELAGQNLVCYCKPAACHGDVLLLLANPELDNPIKGSLFE